MTIFLALYISLCVLNLGDVYSTLRGVRAGAVEGNPVLVKLLGKRPKAFGLLAVKAAFLVYLGVIGHGFNWVGTDTDLLFLIAANAGYAALVYHNMRVARRLEAKNN